MTDGFGGRKVALYLHILVVVSSLLLFGCSMQKPGGSTVDSVRVDTSTKPREKPQEQNITICRKPLKVNYLTPVSDIRNPEVFIYKEKRRLYIVDSEVLVRDYPIGLGFQPKGDKEREGDGRTPEGEFFICTKNPNSRFNRSLGLSYPTRRHAERAIFSDLITPIQFKDIVLSVERKAVPPWNTALGGEIFIHGGGAFADWTEGCVALYDSDMQELFTVANIGTPVTVMP